MFNTIPCNPFPPSSEQAQASGGGETLTVQRFDYTGVGAKTIQHTFEKTPRAILCISVNPDVDNENKDWHFIDGFAWGCKMSQVRWCVGANNEPKVDGNSGNYTVGLSYDSNKLTVTGRDNGGACNISGVKYTIFYI